MNLISKTLTVVGTATAIVASSLLPVEARPTPGAAEEYFDQHIELARTIELTGTDFQLNPPRCNQEGNTYGWYNGMEGQLVVCQQNVKHHNFNEVAWTEEDLDTLRHEAHHLVQDCMDDRLDGRLTNVYEDVPGLVKAILGYEKVARILDVYSDLPDHHQVMELEAFAVADMDDPEEQIKDIHTYCL